MKKEPTFLGTVSRNINSSWQLIVIIVIFPYLIVGNMGQTLLK